MHFKSSLQQEQCYLLQVGLSLMLIREQCYVDVHRGKQFYKLHTLSIVAAEQGAHNTSIHPIMCSAATS